MRASLPLRRFVVHDTSMRPTLEPRDRVLVATWARARPGDVVVVRDPERRSSFLVKRVANLQPNGDLLVRGDNPNASRDSRHFGALAHALLVGRVVYRYLPSHRRGWLV
jgi:nickel-type superoxide dismutase maturation protease